MANKRLPESSTIYVLKALMLPYSGPNVKLVYRPEQFFNDLEKISKAKKRNLKTAFQRAIRNGLVNIGEDGIPRLTDKGWRKVKPLTAEHLARDVSLIVIFDIPEAERWKRSHLRSLLTELKFKQVQKSVWQSAYDHRELLREEVRAHGLRGYVKIYEAADLKLI